MPDDDKQERGPILLPARRYRQGQWETFEDAVSVEIPLHIHWQDALEKRQGETRLWAWPHDLGGLALGHVLLDVCGEGNALPRQFSLRQTGENNYAVSLEDRTPGPLPAPPASLSAEKLFEAMRAFISAKGHWDGTGCFHRAGLYDPAAGKLLFRAEDIGRHNCLDRIAGWSALARVPLSDKVLLTSARITASLCAKALRAGFSIMVSRSAVTSASAAMSLERGVTLVGFARTDEERFTVFADGPGRIPGAEEGRA